MTQKLQLKPLSPMRGIGLFAFVIPGMMVWFIAFVVLLFFIPQLRAHDAMVWLWTALAGWLLGFFGMGVYFWQRAAARRGSRGANKQALAENIGHHSD